MAITLIKITPRQHTSAVAWIGDAFRYNTGWSRGYTAQQAYRIIQHRYSGGWTGFLRDLGDDIWY